MSNIIFTFSGTGNSLQLSRELFFQLKDTRVIPISRALDDPPDLAGQDRVGIVTPVYALGLPHLVELFINSLVFNPRIYCFGIVTYGWTPGNALHDLNQLIIENGGKLHYGQAVKMVRNQSYIPAIEKRQGLLLRSDQKIRSICYELKERRKKPVASWENPAFSAFHQWLMKRIQNTGSLFSVSSACTGCNRCVDICPVGNIRAEGNAPVFGRECEGCLACVSWCPVKAITVNSRKKQTRYRNPKITAEELICGSYPCPVKKTI